MPRPLSRGIGSATSLPDSSKARALCQISRPLARYFWDLSAYFEIGCLRHSSIVPIVPMAPPGVGGGEIGGAAMRKWHFPEAKPSGHCTLHHCTHPKDLPIFL
jgi:hypothetical protein